MPRLPSSAASKTYAVATTLRSSWTRCRPASGPPARSGERARYSGRGGPTATFIAPFTLHPQGSRALELVRAARHCYIQQEDANRGLLCKARVQAARGGVPRRRCPCVRPRACMHPTHRRLAQMYRIFNTWLGHPVDLVKLEAIAGVVRDSRLVENTAVTGEYLLSGLEELQGRFPALLSNVRGQGTFCAADLPTGAARDALLLDLRQRGALFCSLPRPSPACAHSWSCAGIEIGGCGDRTMRCRPALVFQPKHATVFLETLEAALAAL